MGLWLRFILVLLACGGLVCVTTALLMARLFLRPPRMTDGKALYVLQRLAPSDLGLSFETVRYTVRDQRTGKPLELAGWWMPVTNPDCKTLSDRTVVLLHGYADAKVGAIAWAPPLLAAGANVLAIDLRAHGESDGDMTTAGYFERHDVDQVIDQLKSAKPAETQRVFLMGVSLGSATAIATAALRDDIAGVVLDSSVADFVDGMAVHTRLLGAPGGFIARLSAVFAGWRVGARFDEIRPVDLVAKSKCPVLVIQGTADPFTPEDVRQHYADALTTAARGSRQVVLEDVRHLTGLNERPVEYADAVRAFLAPS